MFQPDLAETKLDNSQLANLLISKPCMAKLEMVISEN